MSATDLVVPDTDGFDLTLDDVTDVLIDLFVTERGRFVMMCPGRKPFIMRHGNGYVPLTRGHVRRHIGREYAIAIFASPDGSKFVCFDVDDGHPETVRGLIRCIAAFGISRDCIQVSFSGRKGYHVEVFFDEPVGLDKLRQFYEWVIQAGGFDRRKVEYRPSDRQAIKLPLSIHYETRRVCWFVDRDTLEVIESYEPLFEIKRWSAEDLLTRLHAHARSGERAARPVSRKPYRAADLDLEAGSREDYERISAVPLTAAGTRHYSMLRIAVYQRHRGASREECLRELMSWCARQDKRLIKSTWEEVKQDAEGLLDWVYGRQFVCGSGHARDVKVTVSRFDMDRVMWQPNRIRRKLMFIILAHDQIHFNRISQARLSEMIRADHSTVKRALAAMQREGDILVRVGQMKKSGNGKYYRNPNAYFAVGGQQAHQPGDPQAGVEFEIADMWNDFSDVYYGAIDALYATEELLGRFKPQETNEYMTWVNAHRRRVDNG